MLKIWTPKKPEKKSGNKKRRLKFLGAPDDTKERLKETLTAVENKIKDLEVEHIYIMTSGGQIIKTAKGNAVRCMIEFCGYTPIDIMYRGNIILTHNHPPPGLPQLSEQDIQTAAELNFYEVRAVSPSGEVWRIKRPKEGWKTGVTARMEKVRIGES